MSSSPTESSRVPTVWRPEVGWETRLGIQSVSCLIESQVVRSPTVLRQSWLGNPTRDPKYVLFGRESSSQVTDCFETTLGGKPDFRGGELTLSWLPPLSEGVRCLE